MRRPTYSLAWTIFTATNLWAKKSGWSFGTGSSGSGGRSRRLRRRWTPTSPGSKRWTANGVYGCDLTYSGTEDDRGQGKSRIVQGKRSLFRERPRRVLLGNLRVSGHKKRLGSCGFQPFSILLYSVRYRLPLIVRVIMMFLFQKPGARFWGNGERKRRRAPGYWLYSYSTYVLRSIQLKG